MSQPLLSEIFRLAADKHLNTVSETRVIGEIELHEYSCNALLPACRELFGDPEASGLALREPALAFMVELGLPDPDKVHFHEFEVGIEKQSVRYAWLDFCALIAEEEGR